MVSSIIPINVIGSNPFQPRKEIDENYLQDLTDSINKNGLLSPIIVRKKGNQYQLIAGEMRLQACKRLGMIEIEAFVHEDISDFTCLLLAISENIHRKNLTSTEREDAIYELWKLGILQGQLEASQSKKDLATQLGVTPQTINNIIKAKELRDEEEISQKVSTSVLTATSSLSKGERSKLIKRVEKGDIPSSSINEYVKVIKTASEPVRKALLTPRSQLKPLEAKIIDTQIEDDSTKVKAIKKISSTKTFDQSSVEKIAKEVAEEDKPPKTELKFYIDRVPGLEGDLHTYLRKIEDGSIITLFEGTPPPRSSNDVVCPHFLELKWARGCPFNCAWCYLQGTYRFLPEGKKPVVRPYDIIAHQVEYFLDSFPKPSVLNSGELADSLMWESKKEPFSTFILSLFRKNNPYGHKILFLTKNDQVQNILDMDAQDIAIVSFTVNAFLVSDRWERGAPSTRKRIQAAARLSKAGYETRLRIDPVVPVDNWKKQYLELIDEIFTNFKPNRITFGSLRGLQSTINFAKDTSWVKYLSETSSWGKKVSFKTRHLIYKTLIDYLSDNHEYTDISFCKETLAMWAKLGMDWRKIKCNCVF